MYNNSNNQSTTNNSLIYRANNYSSASLTGSDELTDREVSHAAQGPVQSCGQRMLSYQGRSNDLGKAYVEQKKMHVSLPANEQLNELTEKIQNHWKKIKTITSLFSDVCKTYHHRRDLMVRLCDIMETLVNKFDFYTNEHNILIANLLEAKETELKECIQAMKLCHQLNNQQYKFHIGNRRTFEKELALKQLQITDDQQALLKQADAKVEVCWGKILKIAELFNKHEARPCLRSMIKCYQAMQTMTETFQKSMNEYCAIKDAILKANESKEEKWIKTMISSAINKNDLETSSNEPKAIEEKSGLEMIMKSLLYSGDLNDLSPPEVHAEHNVEDHVKEAEEAIMEQQAPTIEEEAELEAEIKAVMQELAIEEKIRLMADLRREEEETKRKVIIESMMQKFTLEEQAELEADAEAELEAMMQESTIQTNSSTNEISQMNFSLEKEEEAIQESETISCTAEAEAKAELEAMMQESTIEADSSTNEVSQIGFSLEKEDKEDKVEPETESIMPDTSNWLYNSTIGWITGSWHSSDQK